jgi:hypothetical protein
VAVIGTMLPWIDFDGVSANGFGGAGGHVVPQRRAHFRQNEAASDTSTPH